MIRNCATSLMFVSEDVLCSKDERNALIPFRAQLEPFEICFSGTTLCHASRDHILDSSFRLLFFPHPPGAGVSLSRAIANELVIAQLSRSIRLCRLSFLGSGGVNVLSLLIDKMLLGKFDWLRCSDTGENMKHLPVASSWDLRVENGLVHLAQSLHHARQTKSYSAVQGPRKSR